MKKLILILIALLCFGSALADSWIPKDAELLSSASRDGIISEVYFVSQSGETLTYTFEEATGEPLALSGGSDYVPGAQPDRTAAMEAVPGAWVISVRETEVNGAAALELQLVHESFYGSILFADGMIIGRDIAFAPCIRNGRLTMTGAVSVLSLLRPGVSIAEIELDDDDGLLLYEGEAFLSGQEYEFELDAHTARLLQWSR